MCNNALFFENSIMLINIETVMMALKFCDKQEYQLIHLLVFENAVLERRLCIWAYTWDLLSEPKSSFTSKTTPHGRSITKIPGNNGMPLTLKPNNLLVLHILLDM